ncbi:MAG: asparagine synthase (glutamine-hydrolyzing) [Candidatus Solibacter usitatus]|nr:asparagine synthase (glutamine-hydrolyzing) [Candidatus Solibacter usitatus]
MCGIAGYTTIDFHPPAGRIDQLTRAIVHRGPDQQGVYRSASVSMGAVRLSIIDVAGGDQPVYSDDRDNVIVFNGEIYNHSELRRELESLGHRFQSRCDTEVVLRGFLQWDTGCFARLRGMFGVALWCESKRRLVLARDRMGIKPLYVHRRGRDLFFGSELKTILEHPEIERSISPEGLSYYLSLNYIPRPHTMLAAMEKLEPGAWLEWRDGAVRTESYWKLQFRPNHKLRLEDAKQQLDVLLRDAVREHLVSDVPLGVWSSGGIDSSTVLHYAAAELPQVKTFSVSFQGRSFDESPYFREVAAKYATDHHEFDLNPEEGLIDAIEQMAYFSDEPSADAGALPVWFLSKMTRRHVTVALSGEGADELFGGYYTYLADRFASWMRWTPALPRKALLSMLHLWPVSDDKISLEFKTKRFLAGSLLPPLRAHLYWNGTFDDRHKHELCDVPAANWGALLPPHAEESGRLNRFLWADQLCYLSEDILYKCDRMSMAHSLEVRPPFLDHRIVEFAASLPDKWKVNGSRLKFLLKELMRDKLPHSVLTRRKEGFDIPAHQWFRGPLKELLLDTLSEKAVKETGIFHWPVMRRVLEDHFERRANYGYHLWGLLTLFLWMRRWKVTAGVPQKESLAWAGTGK